MLITIVFADADDDKMPPPLGTETDDDGEPIVD